MFTPWIVINFRHLPSPFICNLLGIFKPYVLWSLKDKLQNFCLNNKVFSWGKCWQQFNMQQIDGLTLCMDSTDNTLSILKTKPVKSTSFRFLLWILFVFFTPIVPTLSSSNIWISLMLTQSQDNTKYKTQHGPHLVDR
jgi:hypothetical protein